MKLRHLVLILLPLSIMLGCKGVSIPGFGKAEGPQKVLIHSTELTVQGPAEKVLGYFHLAERPEGSCVPWQDDYQKQGEEWHHLKDGKASFVLYDLEIPNGEKIYKCFAREYKVSGHEPLAEIVELAYDKEEGKYVGAKSVGTLNRSSVGRSVILLGESPKE